MNTNFYTNYSETSFLNKIKESLKECTTFAFSVSFIKYAGLLLMKNEIEDALKRGANGRIITSTYQNFTDIESLNTFIQFMNEYDNFDCHLDFECFGDNGFHSKGYYFEYKDSYELLVGSSNITRYALLKNIEWDLAIRIQTKNETIIDANNEFDRLWSKTLKLDKTLVDMYRVRLDYSIEKWDMDYISSFDTVNPNYMQRKALKELRRYRDMGVKKALIIASTGSGKTYLGAFDTRNFDAKRILYIVHRENILLDARKTFLNVFGGKYTCGIYTGNKKELDADFIFSTNITMSMNLDKFSPTEFDYIILDECHHLSDGGTYKKIMDYFKPEFLLGLTATPDRMDNKDIYGLFDKNVPYELRLRDAILNDLVTPFHYYGIRDKLLNYDDNVNDHELIKEISNNTHIEFVISEIEKHRLANQKLKAIVFCKTIDHAKKIASSFNQYDYNAISLVGNNNVGERIRAFHDLQDEENSLQIICAVDILNEGVDIPGINMVVFLRPTESSTIFIQQLGRGLRKYQDKPYLVVLDFIGNSYKRSTQIAMALGSLNQGNFIEKRLLQDLVRNDFETLGLPIKIYIDELAKEEMLSHIENTNFNTKHQLRKDYENFKKYIGLDTFPKHMDYLKNECSPDLMRLIRTSCLDKKHSYYNFLKDINEESLISLSKEEVKVVNALSDMLPLVRLDEYFIILDLINNDDPKQRLGSYKITDATLNHAYFMLTKEGLLKDDNLNFDLSNIDFKEFILDVLEYGIERYLEEFGEFDGAFKLYANYQKKQIMQVLLKESSMSIQGATYDKANKITYLYVGLKKDINEELYNYKDKFLSTKVFQWESINNTTVNSTVGKTLRDTEVVHLFIRKIEREDGITLPFTYFGTGKFTNMRESTNANTPTLMFDIILDNEVPSYLQLDFNIKGDRYEES